MKQTKARQPCETDFAPAVPHKTFPVCILHLMSWPSLLLCLPLHQCLHLNSEQACCIMLDQAPVILNSFSSMWGAKASRPTNAQTWPEWTNALLHALQCKEQMSAIQAHFFRLPLTWLQVKPQSSQQRLQHLLSPIAMHCLE